MKLRVLTAILAAFAASSCTPEWAKESDADVLLIMDSVLGQKGGSEETGTTQLLSDVRSPGIFNDNAELTLRAMLKIPTAVNALNGINDILLKRYTIHYYRADGRSVQGVDVPHDLAGEMSGRVPVNGSLITSIIVVRHQAKLEPPLRNLSQLGGEDIITVFADVTVYGETVNKRTVKASGRLEIVFADFADED